MPISIRSVDHERQELEVVAFGRIHYTDVERHLLEERNVGGLAYGEFIDARDAKVSFAMSPSEIRQIVALVRRLGREQRLGPTAVLVSTDFTFGVMRAMEVLIEDVADVRPFHDEGIARSWLASGPEPNK